MSNEEAFTSEDISIIEDIINSIENDTKKEVISIKLDGEKATIFDSKIGGIPYCPGNIQLPKDSEGNQLRLLAQINCSQLPNNNILPNKGMLQFFLLDDDCYGLDFDNQTANDKSKVIYYEDIDLEVDEFDVIEKLNPYCQDEESYFPVQNEIKIKFSISEEGISTGDYKFDKIFMERFKKEFPDKDLDNIYCLPDIIFEEKFESIQGMGHKIGGYPGFTQTDPREYNKSFRSYDTVLFQLDSESYNGDFDAIMWGDCGICNFFISEEDLNNKEFGNVLYNWDCC